MINLVDKRAICSFWVTKISQLKGFKFGFETFCKLLKDGFFDDNPSTGHTDLPSMLKRSHYGIVDRFFKVKILADCTGGNNNIKKNKRKAHSKRLQY